MVSQIGRIFPALFIRETGVTTVALFSRVLTGFGFVWPEVMLRKALRFRRLRFFRAAAFFIRAASGPATSLKTSSKFLPEVARGRTGVLPADGDGPEAGGEPECVRNRTGLWGVYIQDASICLNFRVNRLRTAGTGPAPGDRRCRKPGDTRVVWPVRGL